MKNPSHTEGSRRVIFGLSALLIAASFQVFPVLTISAADGDDADSSTTSSTSSSASSKPATTNSASTTSSTQSNRAAATAARTTITAGAPQKPRDHAGATVINEDSTAGDDADQTSAATGAATTTNKSKTAVPIVEYAETSQTVALCKQAAAYSNQKQYPQAISVLTQAITRDPRTIEARRLYAQATILNNEPDRAISVLVLLANYTRPTVYDKCLLASAYYAKRNTNGAISAFKDATEIAPDNFYAEEGLLRSILLGQDFRATLAECTAALGRFKYPSAQVAIRKIYAQAIADQNAAKANELRPGDSRLSPPVPLPELTRYIMDHSYGG